MCTYRTISNNTLNMMQRRRKNPLRRQQVIRILKKRLDTKKIISSQVMNRKERYMFKKNNMMRHIKFLSSWIKIVIPLLTFTITKKDRNNKSRGQFATFYMRFKNEASTTKDTKERII